MLRQVKRQLCRKGESKGPINEEVEVTSGNWHLLQIGKRSFTQPPRSQTMVSNIPWWKSCLELRPLPGAQTTARKETITLKQHLIATPIRTFVKKAKAVFTLKMLTLLFELSINRLSIKG